MTVWVAASNDTSAVAWLAPSVLSPRLDVASLRAFSATLPASTRADGVTGWELLAMSGYSGSNPLVWPPVKPAARPGSRTTDSLG